MSEAAFTDSTTARLSPRFTVRARLGQIDEHELAHRLLRVIRDADAGGAVASNSTHS